MAFPEWSFIVGRRVGCPHGRPWMFKVHAKLAVIASKIIDLWRSSTARKTSIVDCGKSAVATSRGSTRTTCSSRTSPRGCAATDIAPGTNHWSFSCKFAIEFESFVECAPIRYVRTREIGARIPAPAEAVRGVLAEIGYADALLARELPDGSLQLIDGHLRRTYSRRVGAGVGAGRQ